MAVVGVASVRIKPDLSEFRRELEEGLKKMDPEVKVKVHADTDPAFREILKFEKFAERFHSIELPVESDTRVLKQSRTEVNNLGRDLLRMGTSATKAFGAITLGLASLNSAIGIIAGISSFAVAASGSLLLIPGAALAAAAAIGTMKLGADGAKKAFEGLTPTLDRLKAQVSGTFEKSLTPSVENLRKLLPQLSGGFQSIARAIGNTATEFTKMLRAPDNVKTLNGILGDTSKILGNVGKAASPVGRALLDIGKVGTGIFADLSKGIEGAANKFADWIRGLRDSGQLEKFMKNGLDALGDLLDVLGDIGSIISEVFGALREGGAGVGEIFRPAIQTIKEFVSSAEGQETFKALGTLLKEVSEAVSKVLGPALKAISPIIKPLGELIGRMAGVVADSLAPAFERIGEIAGPLVEALTPFVEQIVRALIPIIPTAVGLLGQFASVAILLTPVLMALTIPIALAVAGILALGQAMRGDVVGAAETMKTGFANASATMKSITETDWATMAANVAEATSNIELNVDGTTKEMSTSWGAAMLGMKTDTTTTNNDIINSMKGNLPQVPLIAGGAMDATTDKWGSGMLDMENSTATGLVGVAQTFGELPGNILGIIGDLTGTLFDAGQSIGRAFARGIRSMIGDVSGAANGLAAAAAAYFPHSPAELGPFSGKGWVLYSGRALGEGFAQGISDSSRLAVASTEQMMREVAAVQAPDLSTGFSGLDARFAAGDNVSAVEAELTGRPVNVNITGDRDGLREFVAVEIEEENLNTRRRVLSGSGG